MKKTDRINAIMNYLEKNSIATINDLSKIFKVSNVTIRRDLNELSQKQLVTKLHGSVILHNAHKPATPNYKQKSLENVKEKKIIAREAFKFIRKNSVIFINGGSTVLELIALIDDPSIVIVTNNAMAINYAENSKTKFIIAGGVYNPDTCSFSGELTLRLLSTINANSAFLGTNGFSAQGGLSTYSQTEANINALMINKCAGNVFILADHSKIGKVCNYTNEYSQEIDCLITDHKADKNELDNIAINHNLKVVYASEDQQTF